MWGSMKNDKSIKEVGTLCKIGKQTILKTRLEVRGCTMCIMKKEVGTCHLGYGHKVEVAEKLRTID